MGFSSVLLLTLLLAIGLVFFLRAASKDRTTVVDVRSTLPPLKVLNGLSVWLEERGWKRDGGDADRQLLRFQGSVASSRTLAVLLSIFGSLGSACLGLVITQLYPVLGWWPLLLALIGGPAAGFVYQRRAARMECLELRLISSAEEEGSLLRIRAHRDELIAIELELAKSLQLATDGSLLSSPI
ncbi:cofactor assembly of complex C subunit B [Prochlorococcus sp. MIT 1307]|uniref:cofactor assembly of complex C subunit B n=1 Tax=Prochlorococcus sp. MIT 1307 TaxID=3096219 RepID=UPI002A762923|nr:cofactor assembly of complex C subunit B [Prochlorococcus sp. MIT 1307]